MEADKSIWSVGGGKGGIGKSVTTANIGCALASMGFSVILVDADLGGANLHTYFGIKTPQKGLDDFLKNRVHTLQECAIETEVKGLSLISGAGEFLGIANPAYSQKQKLISHIKKLNADYILVDLGAGTNYNVLDFFGISSEGIVVLAPEPAAIQNAYVFLKSFVYRRLARLFTDHEEISVMIKDATDGHSANAVRTVNELIAKIYAINVDYGIRSRDELRSFRPRLILNMAASDNDIKVAEAFRQAAHNFLSIDTEFAGVIYSSGAIKSAARKMRPFMLDEAATDARRDVNAIVAKLRAGKVRAAAPVLEDKPKAEVHADDEPDADAAAHEAPKAGIGVENKTGGEGRPERAAKEESRADERARAGETQEGASQEIFGYNDNVNHLGMVFHVQTEVQGSDAPVIETIIYHGGRIFFSKKTSWKDAPEEHDGSLSLKDYALRQHRTAIAAIKMNKITLT